MSVSAKHLPSLRDEQEIGIFLALILMSVFWLALSSPPGSVYGHLGLGWKSHLFTEWRRNFSVVISIANSCKRCTRPYRSGLDIAGGQYQLLLDWGKKKSSFAYLI